MCQKGLFLFWGGAGWECFCSYSIKTPTPNPYVLNGEKKALNKTSRKKDSITQSEK